MVELVGFALAAASSVSLGISKILTRKGLLTMDLTSGVFLTLLPALPILLGFTLALGEFSKSLVLTPWSVLLVFLGGFFNHNLGRQLIYGSIKTIGASRTGQVSSLQIPLASFLGLALLGEELSLLLLLGTSLVFFGILAIAFSGPSMGPQIRGGRFTFLKGLSLGLGGGVVWALAWVSSRAAVISLGSALFAALLGYVTAFLVQGALVSVKGGLRVAPRAGRKELLFLLGSGVATAIGYTLYYMSLALLPVVLAAPISSLSPVVATVGSYLLIQTIERVNLGVVLATVLVFAGSYLVVSS